VNEKTLLEYGSLEIDNTFFKAKAIPFNDNGIKTKFLIQKYFYSQSADQKDFLVILLNAKTLKQRYFEGITKNNILEVYKYIIMLNIINIRYTDFLKFAKVSDLDIKVDFLVQDQKIFYDLLQKDIEENKKSNIVGRGYKRFNSKDNRGIEFSTRQLATENIPYFKIYEKKTELYTKELKDTSKINKFYSLYCKDFAKHKDSYKVQRAELTLKNKKAVCHFLNIEDNTLELVLNTKQKKFQEVFQKVKSLHITTLPKLKEESILTPTQILFFNAKALQLSILVKIIK
jgi:hypothetical protein